MMTNGSTKHHSKSNSPQQLKEKQSMSPKLFRTKDKIMKSEARLKLKSAHPVSGTPNAKARQLMSATSNNKEVVRKQIGKKINLMKMKTMVLSSRPGVKINEDPSLKSRLFSGHSKVTYASSLTGGIAPSPIKNARKVLQRKSSLDVIETRR